MNILKELGQIGDYQPFGGDLQLIYSHALQKAHSREELFVSVNEEKQMTRTYFNNLHLQLEESLLASILEKDFSDYSKAKRIHFKIWKNFAACKILLGLEKRKIAISIINKLYHRSQRNGLIEIALSLAKILETHYAGMEPNTTKFHRFQGAVIDLQKRLSEETLAQSTYAAFTFCLSKKKETQPLAPKIKALTLIAEHNQDYRFNLLHYTLLALWHEQRNDIDALLDNHEKAMDFFQQKDIQLPYTTQFSFLFRVTPVYILRQQYAKAERTIKQCWQLCNPNGPNYQHTCFYFALLGFHAQKPQMTKRALDRAAKSKATFASQLMNERWLIVRAYLFFWQKLGKVQLEGDFRLYRFINEIETVNVDKSQLNPSIIIAELIHCLADAKQARKEGKNTAKWETRYMNRTEKVKSYIKKHLKESSAVRIKIFLKMLIKIEDADFYRKRAELRTVQLRYKLRQTKRSCSLDMGEIIPFEDLWGEVLGLLR